MIALRGGGIYASHMAMSGSHSAAGNALGYVYQCQWALVELAERGLDDPLVELRLETLDDIDFAHDGTADELLQVKHQVKPADDLTENSPDLWRTINVWLDTVDLDRATMPVLRLVTTAGIPEHGTLTKLRDDDKRDVEAVLHILETAAVKSRSSKTQAWREAFMKQSPDRRLALIDSIVIHDESPHAGDIDRRLRRAFGYLLPRGREEDFLRYLKGWWSGVSVRLLNRTLPAIVAEDLRIHAENLRDQFGPQNLPVAPEILAPFSNEDAEVYRERPFVAQLMWIALDEVRLLKAIRDYHRAYTQRSEWLRRSMVCEAEIDSFAFALHDEWEQIFDKLVARARRSGAASSAEEIGMTVFEEVCAESRARIRDRFDHSWLNRGTFHQMAEGFAGLTIGWHPDFIAKLEELLSPVVKEHVN